MFAVIRTRPSIDAMLEFFEAKSLFVFVGTFPSFVEGAFWLVKVAWIAQEFGIFSQIFIVRVLKFEVFFFQTNFNGEHGSKVIYAFRYS